MTSHRRCRRDLRCKLPNGHAGKCYVAMRRRETAGELELRLQALPLDAFARAVVACSLDGWPRQSSRVVAPLGQTRASAPLVGSVAIAQLGANWPETTVESATSKKSEKTP